MLFSRNRLLLLYGAMHDSTLAAPCPASAAAELCRNKSTLRASIKQAEGTFMNYALLADLIVAIHVAYVSYIVIGQMAIMVGAWRGWQWIHNRWFRATHLLAITTVALEAVFGIACPLTVWEDELRRAAGNDVSAGTFVGRFLHRVIFYELPPWVFTTIYVAFALVVLASLFWVPVHWRSRRPSPPTAVGGRAPRAAT
jgi:hypothetical protein